MNNGPPIYFFEIIGQPFRKSNQRQIKWVYRRKNDPKRYTHGAKRPIVTKSEGAIAWVKEAISQVPNEIKLKLGTLKDPLGVVFFITYRSEKSDLSSELICDMMQAAGIVKDDRYLREKHEYFFKNPLMQGVKVLLFSTIDDPILVEIRQQFINLLPDKKGAM